MNNLMGLFGWWFPLWILGKHPPFLLASRDLTQYHSYCLNCTCAGPKGGSLSPLRCSRTYCNIYGSFFLRLWNQHCLVCDWNEVLLKSVHLWWVTCCTALLPQTGISQVFNWGVMHFSIIFFILSKKGRGLYLDQFFRSQFVPLKNYLILLWVTVSPKGHTQI